MLPLLDLENHNDTAETIFTKFDANLVKRVGEKTGTKMDRT
jgi:hypothetical protein